MIEKHFQINFVDHHVRAVAFGNFADGAQGFG